VYEVPRTCESLADSGFGPEAAADRATESAICFITFNRWLRECSFVFEGQDYRVGTLKFGAGVKVECGVKPQLGGELGPLIHPENRSEMI
jgi:hypothetical protein